MVDQSDDLYQLNFSQDSGLSNPEGSINVKDIHSVIDSFTDEYRRPFSLYIAGYRYAEIADQMGLPLGTVKSRIHQARVRLQSALKDMRYD